MAIPEKDSPEDIMDQWRGAYKACNVAEAPMITYDHGVFLIRFKALGPRRYPVKAIKEWTRNLRRRCGAEP